MPPKNYMVVDPQHDYSVRIPRPDLPMKQGTPKACTNCHRDKSAEWAARQVKRWYDGEPKGSQHYAEALAPGRNGKPAAGQALAKLARDNKSPDIARATALAALDPYLGPETLAPKNARYVCASAVALN